MGTNYYWYEEPTCPHCKRDCEPLHIGKSSGGWCFGLHVYPDCGIRSLEDWEKRWAVPGSVIKDEYGTVLSASEMRGTVTNRSWPHARQSESPYAVPGPNGLSRHKLDWNHCIGHGEGTWDYCVGHGEGW